MGWPKKLVLVRHAESEGNVLSVDERANYDLATHSYKLTERGREQAKLTGEYLRSMFGQFDTYYTSYYARAKETMKILYPGAKVYEDSRLAEAQRGIYHTMTHDEIAKRYPEELVRKEREGLYHYRPWGGENWADIELRIHSFLTTLNRDCTGENVLIVVHGRWFILFQKLIEHFPIEEALRRYKEGVVKNASISVYNGESSPDGPFSRLRPGMSNFAPWEGKV